MLSSFTPSSRRSRLLSHRLLPHAVLAGGLLLSAWLAYQSFEARQSHIAEEFRGLARERLDSLRLTLATALRLSAALNSHGGTDADPSEIPASSTVARDLPAQFGLSSIQWAPRVPASQRSEFEARMRRAGHGDFLISGAEAYGHPQAPAGLPAEHFPIAAIHPFADAENRLGLDHYADPLRRAAIDKARDTGQAAALVRTRVDQASSVPSAFGFVFHPIYTSNQPTETIDQRRQNLAGMAVAQLDLRQFVTRALANHMPVGINIAIFDGAGPDAKLLHFHRSRLESAATVIRPPPPGRPAGPHYTQTLAVADLRWFIVATPSPAFLSYHSTSRPWVDFGAGVSLALCAFLIVRTLQQRVASIAQLEHRQRQLLDPLVAHLPYLIFIKDRSLIYSYANDNLARELGRPLDDILGHTDNDLLSPDLVTLYRADDEHVLTSGLRVERDEPFRRHDGQSVVLHTIKLPMRDASGAITGILGISRDVTEERAAAESLHQLNADLDRRVRERTAEIESANARLRLHEFSVAHASLATFWIAEDARVLHANQAACDLVGYPQEELLRLRIHDFNPDLNPAAWAETWRLRRERKRLHFESRVRRADGRILLVEIDTNWLEFEGHEYSFSFVRDITERKRTETALRLLSTGLTQATGPRFFEEAVRQIARLLELDGVLIGSLHGSAGEEKIFTLGLSLDGAPRPALLYSLAGTPCEKAILGELDAVPHDLCRRFSSPAILAEIGAEAYVGVALRGSRAQPVGILAGISRLPLLDPAPTLELLRLFAVAIGAEVERQRGEKRFSDLFEFSPDALVMTDSLGVIRLVNRRAETMFGWSRHDLAGRTIDVLMPSDSGLTPEALRDRFTGSASPFPIHELRRSLRARHREGRVFPIDISVSPLETEEGVMIAAAIRDISDKKKLEEQFLRAQRMEGIGTLAGGIAHDLNNALVPILTGVSLLSGQVPPEEQTLLEDMRHSAQRAANMVRQLLTYARGSEPDRRPLDPATLLHEMEQIARRTFAKNIEVLLRHAPGSLRVLGDSTQLHQILLNLCVNARDAMPAGGTLTLSSSLSHLDPSHASPHGVPPGDYVTLTVADTGVGIPPETLERLFTPFFTTKGVGKGTGLGLATALGIAKSHGGFIDVESEPGSGSRFHVYLPASPASPAPAPATPPPIGTTAPFGQGRLILFVDDEPSICILARRLLETANFTTLTAANGLEAMARLDTDAATISAVIVDMDMPGLDGPGFIRQMRTRYPTLPVVATSGHFRPHQMADLRSLGVSVFLPKPFVRAELLDSLQQALQKNAPTPTPASDTAP